MTDSIVMTTMRYDQRDEMRKHELQQTYIEAPTWKPFEEDSYSHFFEDLDRTTEKEFEAKRDNMVLSHVHKHVHNDSCAHGPA